MADGKEFVLEWTCDALETFGGGKWISKDEMDKIRQVSTVSPGCDICRLTIKDESGKVMFEKEGCC